MSNKQRSSHVSHDYSTRTTNNARVAKPRKAVKRRKEKMPASNKWMLILSIAFIAARLIFPDILAVLGSALGGLTVVAVIALVLALAATFFGKSVGNFLGSLFGGLVGTLRDKAGIDEDEFEVDEYYEEPRARMPRPVAVSYDDDDDYDFAPASYDDELEEEEIVEPETVRQHHRRRPAWAPLEDDTVPVAERPVMPKAPVVPVAPVQPVAPDVELPEGFEWHLEGNKWEVRPIAAPDVIIPDGYEWQMDAGKWKLVKKA